jgi:8-oxo-dGTP diphosphatase
MWDLPGGLGEPGEAPQEVAERETREETGLTIHDLEKYGERLAERDGRNFRFVLFTAVADGDRIKLSYEHDQYKWITSADIPKLELPERLREVLLRLTSVQ